MSICMYARIQKKCITEDLLAKKICDFFVKQKGSTNRDCIIKEKKFTSDEIIITFIEEKKTPYNIYDFNICDKEFEYKQVIIFDIKKEALSKEKYKLIINFCENLGKEIETKVLLTSDVHNEICMIEDENVEWFNNILE